MSKIATKDLVFLTVFPATVGKVGLVYFGLMYSAYPDEGYGYWLSGFVIFTLVMTARFLWKYRHYSG